MKLRAVADDYSGPGGVSSSEGQARIRGESSVARGAAWAMAARATITVLQLATQILLARVLAPRDFGLMASIAVLTTFAMLFTDLGLATAVARAGKISRPLLTTAFWLN